MKGHVMIFKTIAAITATASLAACAPNPEKIQGTYVSPVVYQNLTCEQLAAEAQAVSNRAHDVAGLERRHHRQDQVAVAAGLVIFWPALFFRHGADATTAEVAQLKGQMEAIEAASAAKNCDIDFQRV